MRDTFPFLIRLGLEADADAKDIRRAYARELKKIDQTADPEGFQELREAYEIALQWHAHQQFAAQEAPIAEAQAEIAPEPATAPPLPAAPEPAHEDPRQLAEQAFSKFTSSIVALQRSGQLRHQSRWKAILQDALDHESLFNLTARTIFEGRIAHMLASGWRPGHEALFVAACEVFDWAHDSRRILQFGDAGTFVDRAIDEWKVYESTPAQAMGTIKQLIRLVRSTPEPTGEVQRNDLMLFLQLAERFRNWLAVTIDRGTLNNWLEAAHAESQRPPGASKPRWQKWLEPASESSSSSNFMSRIGTVIIIALLVGLSNLVSEARKPKGFYPPAEKNMTQPAPPKVVDKPPSQEQIEEIRSRIHYKWPADTAPGEYIVLYDVFIDGDGAVLGMNKVQSSGSKGYDEAVAKAIRETSPFPKGTQTRFRLRYGVISSKPEAPKGSPPSKAQLEAVQEKIFYVPSSGVTPGEVRVDYEVEINDKGKVIKLKKLKASRDPAFDDAVADALREADVFTPENRRKFGVTYSRTWGR